ncbi:MAG: DEAD/DEAH box helicase [Bryobacterales bacterium]|nr:DEAD/DEAH box helicase [Bryobacterales bacterium]
MVRGAAAPRAGEIVRVRQRRYVVEEVTDSSAAGHSVLVRMACVDDDAQGQELEVLWDLEADAQVVSDESWSRLAERGFDEPARFAGYLNTLRWNCVTATDANLLQSPFRAGIRVDPYQLEPLRKALRLPRVNLFIADDVGLGKTIEAGLIARELLMRKKAREIVVSCPPSMLLQWQEELEARFGLRFEILDRDYLSQVRRDRGFRVNPWATHSRFLISHRLLVDENYAGGLRDWLGTFRAGTLLILDEAHHAAPAGGQRYAIDSQITRAVRDLAPRFEHRLFLSATPHNGHSNSFSALLEILDPQRFCRGVKVARRSLDDVMVRRLKEDLRRITGGFPERRVEQIDLKGLPPDTPELRLMKLLDEYRQLREERVAGDRRAQALNGLLLCGLQQRLLSSVEAFAQTLRVHRRTMERHQAKAATDVAPVRPGPASFDLLRGAVGADDERAELSEEELGKELEEQVTALSERTGSLAEAERAVLDQMTELAEANRHRPDARIEFLTQWIRREMCPGGVWNGRRIILFTEWDDTKRYLKEQLGAVIAETEQAESRIAIYHGPTPKEEREAIKKAFNAPPEEHPVRILIATDAAREGLNLQAHCQHLFHFDIPWNPSRMEQRNGRIDRKLQPADVVYCYYFYYHDRPEDRVLHAVVQKTKTIRQELGSLSQVVDTRLAGLLERGIRRVDIAALESKVNEADLPEDKKALVKEELDAAREREMALREQIERLRTMKDRSQQAAGFDEKHFRAALSCSLQLVGSGPVEAVSKAAVGPPQYRVPRLDDRGATWVSTMDTLRAPRQRDQKFWDWRRESPIRPVVFEDPGYVTDEVVHLHLEHPLAQRLLSRFLAQGFVHHDLSRACLAQTRDAIPRVILLGRLALYGPGAARLHEELVPVTARWTDAAIRKSALEPYKREAEGKTLELLDDALLRSGQEAVPEKVAEQLRAAAPTDLHQLLPYLEARANEYSDDAIAKLKVRAEAESKAMREILETQKKHIEATVAHHDRGGAQLLLIEDMEEKRQLEDNRRYWGKRLTSLERELESEPARIRSVYEVKARRVEPVGLVYLWPAN